jgi:hypothetical protein
MKLYSAIAVIFLLGVSRGAVSAAQEPAVRVMIPAYFYPGGEGLKEWEKLFATAKRVPTIVIANPASGPGTKVDGNYTAVINRTEAAGITVIGYISSSYTKRPLIEVEMDIDRWLQFYPKINGIFVDEQTSGEADVPYYVALRAYIKKKLPKALVIGNPGTGCSEGYLAKAGLDSVCIFENFTGFEDYKMPLWAAGKPGASLAALTYKTPNEAKMREYLGLMIKRGIGTVFITDKYENGNPWNSMPAYWEAEVKAIEAVNGKRSKTLNHPLR